MWPMLVRQTRGTGPVIHAVMELLAHLSCMQEVDMQRVNGAGGHAGLGDLRTDLEAAVNSIFQGSPTQRRAYVDRLYSQACPFLPRPLLLEPPSGEGGMILTH